MTLTELIEALQVSQDLMGDYPVTMGWSEGATPGPIVAFKIYPGERFELRCERED